MLVEKPIAPDVDSARRLVEAADRLGRVLAVGHVERFNPAVLELDSIVEDAVHIDARRIRPYSPRDQGRRGARSDDPRPGHRGLA